MTEIVILGAGGHARVVAEALQKCGTPASGYVDEKPAANFRDVPYLGDDGALMAKGATGVMLANGIGAVDVPYGRRRLFEHYKDAGFSFVTVVHPAAELAAHVVLEEGAQVLAGTIIQSDVRIGRNVIVNTGVIINHDCVIGDHVHLAAGAVLAGAVQVGEASLVGAGATLIQELRIGAEVVIAAGATVIGDVADGETVAGVPARPVRRRA
jgi:sugar O-acyltransferase (sialic acid O-acetyltransferase NeuD family)